MAQKSGVIMFEMNENQKALFDKLTTLQQEISLNSISGMNDIDSYKNSSGKAVNENTMRASVSEILTNPNVIAFKDSIKEIAVNDAIMSRDRMMEIQTAIANMSDADLAQMGVGFLTEMKAGFDVKLKAMKQLAELAGYEAPKKIEVDVKEELTPWDLITIGENEDD